MFVLHSIFIKVPVDAFGSSFFEIPQSLKSRVFWRRQSAAWTTDVLFQWLHKVWAHFLSIITFTKKKYLEPYISWKSSKPNMREMNRNVENAYSFPSLCNGYRRVRHIMVIVQVLGEPYWNTEIGEKCPAIIAYHKSAIKKIMTNHIYHIHLCFFLQTSPCSHGFPMVFLWFSYGFPMVFLWFSYGFPMVFLWFSYGFHGPGTAEVQGCWPWPVNWSRAMDPGDCWVALGPPLRDTSYMEPLSMAAWQKNWMVPSGYWKWLENDGKWWFNGISLVI